MELTCVWLINLRARFKKTVCSANVTLTIPNNGTKYSYTSFYEKAKLAYLPGENPEGQELEDVLIVKVKATEEKNLHYLEIKVCKYKESV